MNGPYREGEGEFEVNLSGLIYLALLIVLVFAALFVYPVSAQPPTEFTEPCTRIIDSLGTTANALCICFSNTTGLNPNKGAFHSWATNMGSTKKGAKVFSITHNKKEVTLIREDAYSPAYSANGKYIVYEYSPDPDHGILPEIRVYDTDTSIETFVDYSSNGNYWIFPNITILHNDEVIYHSTKTGSLREYSYSIRTGVIAK